MPLTTISQFIGSAYIHTGASHTNVGTTLAPPTTAGGGTPNIEYNPGPGVFSLASVSTPKIAINNLPNGTYKVTMNATAGAGAANASLAIWDGTTLSGFAGYDGGSNRKSICIGFFTYSAPLNNITYELWTANDSSTTTLYADGVPGIGAGHAWDLHIVIEKVA